MGKDGTSSGSLKALRCGAALGLCLAIPGLVRAADPALPVDSGSAFASSPITDKQSSMASKMFDTSGKVSSFDTMRSAFDGKSAPFAMKGSDLTDRRAEIGGRTIYSPMLDSFNKQAEVPQTGLFQGMSPMSGSTSSLAGQKTSNFDAKKAPGFDKSVAMVDYKGREADAILTPKPFAEGMSNGDPMTQQFIKNGGKYGPTMSLEEVRDLINKDVKGASLSIPQPAEPKP
ncbi:hypothetical protein SAMN05444156_1853 [Verrucomicrobium sp. GAS474]|uniref:hypothetical protein n=1 Tax=Verrucomicrobium sp. GAS474 TaxID=1882831 RepID=UPI00087A2197|nr:hypothetical protein [Verrucomicrobium sp. GAS474]SDU08201.1 hypothetical protein SAMN05444156_1853 [Verrucomicrobium sp. GAS474]